jgi:hypothetical protein
MAGACARVQLPQSKPSANIDCNSGTNTLALSFAGAGSAVAELALAPNVAGSGAM